MPHGPKIIALALLGFLWLSVAAPGTAASQDVAIHSVGAPSVYLFQGQWNLRYPKVVNNSDSDRQVLVIYESADPKAGATSYTRLLTLPAKSTVRTELAFRAPFLEPKIAPRAAKASTGMIEEALQLRDASSGSRLGQSQVALKTPLNLKSGALLIGTDHSGYGYSTSYVDALKGQPFGDRVIKHTNLQPAALPDKWYAMEAVKCLVIGRLTQSEMSASQWQALLDWVRSGGTILLTASDELAAMLDGELGQAAGVAMGGMHMTSSLDVPEVKSGRVDLPSPMPMAQLVPVTARVLCTSEGLPLLTCNSVGFGAVLTLAVPSGTLDAGANKPLHKLWGMVAQESRKKPPILNDGGFLTLDRGTTAAKVANTQTGPQVLQKIAGVAGPPRSMPVALLLGVAGAFIVLGAALWFVRKGEWAWVAMVPTCAAISLGIYVVSKGRTNPSKLSYVGLMTGQGDHAVVQEVFSYYSGPKGGDITFVSGNAQATIARLTTGSTGPIETSQITMSPQMSLPDQSLAANSSLPFGVKGIVRCDGLQGELALGPTGLQGRIANRMSWDLNDAVFYFNRKTYRVGKIPAGGSIDVNLDESSRLGSDEFTSVAVKDSADNYRNELLRNMIARGEGVRPQPLVVGYVKASPLSPLPSSDVATQGWTIVTWPLQLGDAQRGKVSIPSAMMNLSLSGANYVSQNDTFIAHKHNATAQVLAKPVGLSSPLKDAKLTLRFATRAEGYRIAVSGLAGFSGKTGREELLKTFDVGTGKFEVVIDSAQRFYTPQHGYALTIKVTTQAPAVDAPNWKFDSIDVSVEGTVQ